MNISSLQDAVLGNIWLGSEKKCWTAWQDIRDSRRVPSAMLDPQVLNYALKSPRMAVNNVLIILYFS